MTSAHRRQTLIDLLADEGRLSVMDLARRLGVSDDTVRRDLVVLEAEGVVCREHGAAALDVPAMGRRARGRVLGPVKRQLGASAVALVRPGMTLMLDAGETVLAVAAALPPGDLTIVTHSLDAAALMADRPRTRLIVAGGVYNPRQRLFEGAPAEDLVRSCRADLAFLGACSVDPTLGVTATDAGDAAVKRAMVASASASALVADHTKWGSSQPWAVAPLSSFRWFLTDRAVSLPGPYPELILSVPPGGNHGQTP